MQVYEANPLQQKSATTLYLGEIYSIIGRPAAGAPPAAALTYLPRGGLAVDTQGTILACDDASVLRRQYREAAVVDFGEAALLPGFVDAHTHLVQTDLIGSYGEDLLGWLNRYTFPKEAEFAAAAVARDTARRFFRETLHHGVTTTAIYGANFEDATNIFFEEADQAGVRAIIGKTSMDRAAPAALLQDAAADYAANKRLIQKWHGHKDRLYYALTPRFAPTCTAKLLEQIGALRTAFPDVYLQTHHAETKDEIAWVAKLFPQAENYLAVYDHFGLLGEKTLLAHCIHITDQELARIRATNTAVVHCPTSNLFLGSGLFPLDRHRAHGNRLCLATDIGGGTSFSMWRTMAAAYEVQKLRGQNLSPIELFYYATLGGAEVLSLDRQTGSFAPGKSADFQVVNWRKSRLLGARLDQPSDPAHRLFAMMHLADDRLVDQVFVRGQSLFNVLS